MSASTDRGAAVLLVSGNDDARELYETALSIDGIEVGTCATAAAALDAARARPPRLIVLDLRLPDAHGSELVRWLRGDPATSGTIILALSTSVSIDGSRGLDAGCDLVLAVPCPPDTLVTQVQHALSARAGRDAFRPVVYGA
jgi:two-component system KDP operon response regulator KdpE